MEKKKGERGVYTLIMKSLREFDLNIGMLGNQSVPKGYLIYIGSGLNGLSKRIERHFKKSKKIKWHIDFLTTNPNIVVLNAIYGLTNKKIECLLSENIWRHGFTPIIKNFGSTDCRKCFSHLYYSIDNPIREIMKVFREMELNPVLWKRINS